MKYKKKISCRGCLLLVLTLLACLFVPIVWDSVRFYRPLIPTTQWDVKAGTHSGKPLSVRVYKMLWDNVFLVRIDGRWFAVDFSGNFLKKRRRNLVHPDDKVHVFWTTPGTFPYLYHRADGGGGLEILHKKIEELWYLSDMGNQIVFSNQTFFVSMTKENSGRPPADVHRSTWE